MKRVLVTSLIATLAIPVSASDFLSRVTRLVEPYVRSNNFSGVILVKRGERVLVRRAYGLANVEHGVAVTTDTKFYIASLSKIFTAVAILQLRDAGKFSLDDPLSRFIPDFPRADRISIRQLLTHRSGLSQDTARPGYFEKATRPLTLSESVESISKVPPAAEPGARRSYANPNYILLARVIELASRETYDGYLKRHVFAPLHMESTGVHQSWLEIVPARAQGYSPFGKRNLYNASFYEYSTGTGAGSAWSTAADLARMMDGLRDGSILERLSVSELFGRSGSEAFVGGDADVSGHHATRLTGWDGVGFASALTNIAADDITIIVLTNRNVPNTATEIAGSLTNLAYGMPVKPLEIDEAPLAPHLLAALAGRYRLGDDFYVPGTILDIVACGDGICERQGDGRVVGLLRTKSGDFIHRSSWGHVQFELGPDGKSTGLQFFDRFHATKM